MKTFDSSWFRLDDKVAIVTGGASGLGAFYTQALLKSGAKVLVVSRSQKGWSELKTFATDNQADVAFIQCDITETDAPQRIMAAVQSTFGQLDILINNAGLQRRATCSK